MLILEKLKKKLQKKRLYLKKKKVLFQDNAPANTWMTVMAKIHKLKFELVDHFSYFPDLVSSNFCFVL